MANHNNPNGLHVLNAEKYTMQKYYVDANYAGGPTDIVYGPDSAGYATDTATTRGIGVQGSEIIDGPTMAVNATASGTVGADYVLIYDDPMLRFWAQITTYTATDPYTTMTDTSAFDVAGTTGVQYIDAAASSYDTCRIIKAYYEPDTGIESVIGAYGKVISGFTNLWHFRMDT